MRLREVFRFEVEYRFRSPSTWIYGGILFLLAIWMFLATADGGPSEHINAPVRLAGVSVIVGMFGMLVSAAIFGDAAVRDIAVEMDALLFTSRLRKAEYLAGRYLAALAVNAILLIAIPLGTMTGTLMGSRFEAAGPFRLVAYLQPFLLLSLPNLLVVGAILFTVGMLARTVIPVFLTAIGIFIASLVSLNYPDTITNPILAPLVDPSALGALQRVARYWTPVEQNTRLVGFPPALLWNRVVWGAIAAGMLAFLARTYRFAHADGGRRRRARRDAIVAFVAERAAPVAVPRVAGSFDFGTTARQALTVARHWLALFAASRAFRIALLACTGLTMLWGWNVGDTVFDTSAWPVTLLVAGTALATRVTPILVLLVIVYAGELVWQERDAGVAEIADAAPVSESVSLLGRFLALAGMIVMMLAAITVGGVLIQALQGYHNFEPGLYLRIVFGILLANYLLLGALAMAIHVFINHKYLAHFAVLLVYVAVRTLPNLGLVEHNLLLYGMDPGWTYSDMNGFGPFAGPFIWFKAYWAAWALMLGVVAALFWVRGRETGLRQRFSVARARSFGGLARAAAVAALLIVALGGFIFYNTNVLNEYRPARQRGAPQADYEKRYARFVDAPQPMIAEAELRVEIHPATPAVDMRGTYRLVNRTGAAIDSVHVYVNPDVATRSLSLDRAAKQVVDDAEVGYRIYHLERPLAPSDSMQLTFDVAYRPRGFPNSDIQRSVVRNGAYFDRRWMPIIGYQPAFELSGDEPRKRFGLGARRAPADDAARARLRDLRDADLVHLKAVIGTAADQTAITPGILKRRWTENGRNYFEYETPGPTPFMATTFSAKYALVEDRWKNVALAIYHHPTHRYTIGPIVHGMKASLDYFTSEFGPYPADHLRIVEIPRYGRFGRAHPYTIAFTEDFLLTRAKEGRFDQAFFGTAHEIAHQWWGGQVHGAHGGRGTGMISESLSNYSAMMVTEKTFGLEAARQVYAYQLDRYLRQRANVSRDVPLLDVTDQAYIYYGKGAVAMYALRERIGEERVNTALRRFLDRYRDAGPPYPTSTELYAELRAVTPDSAQSLLRDLFEDVILWDVEARSASAERIAGGEYRVTIDVVAKKLRADSVGRETPVELDELVEIGVFGTGDGAKPGTPLYLKPHRIRTGRQTIQVTVGSQPTRAGIDPHRKLIDRKADDNVVSVTTGGAGPAERP